MTSTETVRGRTGFATSEAQPPKRRAAHTAGQRAPVLSCCTESDGAAAAPNPDLIRQRAFTGGVRKIHSPRARTEKNAEHEKQRINGHCHSKTQRVSICPYCMKCTVALALVQPNCPTVRTTAIKALPRPAPSAHSGAHLHRTYARQADRNSKHPALSTYLVVPPTPTTRPHRPPQSPPHSQAQNQGSGRRR